jgi:hypothetical protein
MHGEDADDDLFGHNEDDFLFGVWAARYASGSSGKICSRRCR